MNLNGFLMFPSSIRLNHKVSRPLPNDTICTFSPIYLADVPCCIIVSMSLRTMCTLAQQPLCMMISLFPRYCVNSSAKLSIKQPFLMAELNDGIFTFWMRGLIRLCLIPLAAVLLAYQFIINITQKILDSSFEDYVTIKLHNLSERFLFLWKDLNIIYLPILLVCYDALYIGLSSLNQEMEKGYLFTLELRVCRQITKLNVYEQDSLSDLIGRLSSAVTYKQKYAQRLKEKLEAEFKKLVSTQDCSAKVRDKLQSLTQESKLIIVGISQPENNDPADETPFKILLQNSANFRKRSAEQGQRCMNYQHQSPILTRDYDKEPILNFEERANPTKNRPYIGENFRKRDYEQVKPTYDAYDSYNPTNNYYPFQERKTIQDYSSISNLQSKRTIIQNENYEPRVCYGGIDPLERRKDGYIKKHNLAANYDENRKQSFQDYKINKIKSLSCLATNQIRPRYEMNTQEAYQPMFHNKVIYNRNQEDLKIDYSSKYLDNKLSIPQRQKGGKKFSYLSYQNF